MHRLKLPFAGESSGHLEPVVNSIVCGPEKLFFYLAHLPTSGSFSTLPNTLSGVCASCRRIAVTDRGALALPDSAITNGDHHCSSQLLPSHASELPTERVSPLWIHGKQKETVRIAEELKLQEVLTPVAARQVEISSRYVC
jgi:hypothetical protein